MVLQQRLVEFKQFVHLTVEKLPVIYEKIENDVILQANDMIAAVQDQVC